MSEANTTRALAKSKYLAKYLSQVLSPRAYRSRLVPTIGGLGILGFPRPFARGHEGKAESCEPPMPRVANPFFRLPAPSRDAGADPARADLLKNRAGPRSFFATGRTRRLLISHAARGAGMPTVSNRSRTQDHPR